MTAGQLQTLKAAILADPAINTIPMTDLGHYAITEYYNALASPAFTVWKTHVTTTEVGDVIVATELAGMTSLNLDRLRAIVALSTDGVNPSKADRRAFFDDVFSGAGGVGTRAALLALWKRLATRAEQLFATGTGSDADPATMTLEGAINKGEVETARNIP
jgi:hypothetical protein